MNFVFSNPNDFVDFDSSMPGHQKTSNPPSVVANVLASSTATLTAELSTLPLCTLKTVYQTGYIDNQGNRRHFGAIGVLGREWKRPDNAIGYIWERNGLRGFFKASAPAVAAQVFSTASKFTLYQAMQKKLQIRQDQHVTPHVVAMKLGSGICAGILSSLVTHPLDVARVILQRQESVGSHLQHNTSVRSKFQLAYRGYSKTLSKTTVSGALFLPIYDISKSTFENPFIASLVSATISTTAMQPLDYLKTRHMSGMNMVYDQHMTSHLFRGLTINLSRVVPHFAIVMTMTDYLLRQLNSTS